ncbi:hypothetical protein BCR42DRAFT_421215 [Absidia repens]|uniref:Uncharacterized protein n=1 Tax=Absidia repens TaxID=90262 RepID=A0A1X2I887_9FUNG|nr:hypothetical protein BCR42DRAFT_421215 [Absidia repens]
MMMHLIGILMTMLLLTMMMLDLMKHAFHRFDWMMAGMLDSLFFFFFFCEARIGSATLSLGVGGDCLYFASLDGSRLFCFSCRDFAGD